MIQLVSVNARYGWAYVRTPDGFGLLRPPYDELIEVPAAVVIRASRDIGFVASERAFEGISEVTEFLSEGLHRPKIDEGTVKVLLEVATADDIRAVLDALGDSRDDERTRKALLQFWDSEPAREDATLRDRLQWMLCAKVSTETPREPVNYSSRYRYASAKHGAEELAGYSKKVRAAGSVLTTV